MKNRGFSLVEAVVGTALMCGMLLAALTLFGNALRSFSRTDSKLDANESAAIALRKISEDLRSACYIAVSTNGSSVTYQMPQVSPFVDEFTGEQEYVHPISPDGVNQTYYISGTSLMHQRGTETATVVVEDLSLLDRQVGSSYYNSPYPVFSKTNVGSTQGLRIMLITKKRTSSGPQYSRMATTVMVRNKQ